MFDNLFNRDEWKCDGHANLFKQAFVSNVIDVEVVMIWSCQRGQKQMLWAHIVAVKFFYKPGSFVFKWEGFIMLWPLKFYFIHIPLNVKSYWTWCFWQFQIKISKWMKQHNWGFLGFNWNVFWRLPSWETSAEANGKSLMFIQ